MPSLKSENTAVHVSVEVVVGVGVAMMRVGVHRVGVDDSGGIGLGRGCSICIRHS